MKRKKLKVSVVQKLVLDESVTIENCPDPEFDNLECIKIGEDLFLPSIEWTKYVPPDKYSDDGSGGFDPVEDGDWETLIHAIEDEKVTVKKA